MFNITHEMARRDFLRLAGAGALGLGGHLTRFPAAETKPVPRARARTVIQVYLEGGMTQIDTLDPKPKAPVALRSPFKSIPTNVPGIEICETLPLLAKVADKYTLLRSITAPGGGHGGYVMLCNTMMPKESPSTHPSAKLMYPTVGAIVGMKKQEDGSYKGDIPPWVCIPGIPWGGNNYGFLPPRHQGFCVGDPNYKDFRVSGISLSPQELERLKKRRALLEAIGGGTKEKLDAARTAETLRETTFRRLTGDAKKTFEMDQEKDSLRDRYGRTVFGQGCLLARRLAEYGVPFVTVTWGGGDVKDSTGWDMHENAEKTCRLLCPILDQGLSALIEDLAQRGLLETTIVVFHSESGKSAEPNGGRGHWCDVFSALVAGGGFKGGKVVGESDEEGKYVKSRPIYPWDLWESVYLLMGIKPQDKLPNPDGCVAHVSPATACAFLRGGVLTEIM